MPDNQNTIEMLKKTGLRLTKQRILIGDLLFGSKHKHVSAESLHNQIEKLGKKMALATAEDVRVVIIKLADRLHNLKTIEHLPRQKQIKKSKEC